MTRIVKSLLFGMSLIQGCTFLPAVQEFPAPPTHTYERRCGPSLLMEPVDVAPARFRRSVWRGCEASSPRQPSRLPRPSGCSRHLIASWNSKHRWIQREKALPFPMSGNGCT